MDLSEYEGKEIYLIDIDGYAYEGPVINYIYSKDDGQEQAESIVVYDKIRKQQIEFTKNEIKIIKIIEEGGLCYA